MQKFGAAAPWGRGRGDDRHAVLGGAAADRDLIRHPGPAARHPDLRRLRRRRYWPAPTGWCSGGSPRWRCAARKNRSAPPSPMRPTRVHWPMRA